MILPVFLPHLGCEQRCSYCNQHVIANATLEGGLEGYVASLFRHVEDAVEVALYSGNILGLDASQIDRLFSLFDPYRERITGFRLSAKPGLTDRVIVRSLRVRGVRTIELGMPTFNNAILAALNRGHTTEDLLATYLLLQEEDVETGLQVMVGLPEESGQDLREMVSSLVRLAPSFIRIYPLLVIEGTLLSERYKRGEFQPDSLGAGVSKAAFIHAAMEKHGIRTIKMGLTENEVLKENIMAGPYHPAFGYLVKSEVFCVAIIKKCQEAGFSGHVRVLLNRTDVPHLIGHKRAGLKKLMERGIAAEWSEIQVARGSFILEAAGRRVKGEVGDAVAMFPF